MGTCRAYDGECRDGAGRWLPAEQPDFLRRPRRGAQRDQPTDERGHPDRRRAHRCRGRKAKTLLEQEGRDDLRLRVAVQPGGCSGLKYQLFFDERDLEGDNVADFGGVEVVVDRMSAPYLMGAKIDFVDRIDAQGFTIDNPNAQGSCACGDSFH